MFPTMTLKIPLFLKLTLPVVAILILFKIGYVAPTSFVFADKTNSLTYPTFFIAWSFTLINALFTLILISVFVLFLLKMTSYSYQFIKKEFYEQPPKTTIFEYVVQLIPKMVASPFILALINNYLKDDPKKPEKCENCEYLMEILKVNSNQPNPEDKECNNITTFNSEPIPDAKETSDKKENIKEVNESKWFTDAITLFINNTEIDNNLKSLISNELTNIFQSVDILSLNLNKEFLEQNPNFITSLCEFTLFFTKNIILDTKGEEYKDLKTFAPFLTLDLFEKPQLNLSFPFSKIRGIDVRSSIGVLKMIKELYSTKNVSSDTQQKNYTLDDDKHYKETNFVAHGGQKYAKMGEETK